MTYVFIGGVVLLAALAAYQSLSKVSRRERMQWLRWVLGGAATLVAIALLFARRIDIAVFVGAAAFSILKTGRLGPIVLDSGELGDDGADSASKVRSRYFAMELDHSSGSVHGTVRAGQFAGADLIDLGESETRALIREIEGDPDSVSLLESWLDANRAGWREYFEEQARGDGGAQPAGASASANPVVEAYAVLGLEPGATDEEIRAAHRELMKGVHPDHGGSSYLASKINGARDLLLKR